MCGIVGVLSAGKVDRSRVERMRDICSIAGPIMLDYGNPDDQRICFGHRRLSIIKLDVRSNQPTQSSDGRYVISYNGEIYNYKGTRQKLIDAGVTLRTELLNAMRQLGFNLTLPGGILVKVDRASMAISLEVRPVFLHRDVMELAARVPPIGLVNRVAAKLALREAVRPWLLDSLIDRKKQGIRNVVAPQGRRA